MQPEPTPERRPPLVYVASDRALAVLPEPAECPGCHRAVVFVINRGGHTRCLSCDEKAFPVRRAWAGGAA